MKDSLPWLLFAAFSFPLGAALALLILWNDKQQRPPRHRSAANIPGSLAIIGISLNLPFAVLRAVRHDWHGMKESLAIVAFYVLASLGAWVVTRRALGGPSDRPNNNR